MKKTLLILIILICALPLSAQELRDDYYDGIEYSMDMKLNHTQIQKIMRLNTTMKTLYKASKREGGKKDQKIDRKNQLILTHMRKMQEILNEEQIAIWDKIHGDELLEGGDTTTPNTAVSYAEVSQPAIMVEGVSAAVGAATLNEENEEYVENTVPENRVIKRSVEPARPARAAKAKTKEISVAEKIEKLDKDYEEVSSSLEEMLQEGDISKKEMKEIRKKLQIEVQAEKKRLMSAR